MKIIAPIIGVVVAVVLIIGAILVLKNNRPVMDYTPTPTPTNVPQVVKSPIFNKLPSWLPSAKWSSPKSTTQTIGEISYEGQEETSTIETKIPSLNNFEDPKFLESLGFKEDLSFAASGPGGNAWGYKNSKTNQVVIFSYSTTPTSLKPNEPVQFNCPCQMQVSVFVGSPARSS